jgi:hypothetical protein
MADYSASQACQEYWQLHIEAALECGTLPVLLFSSAHFLPKVPHALQGEIEAYVGRLNELDAELLECDSPVLRTDIERLIAEYRRALSEAEAKLPSKPFQDQPIVPAYPLFILNAYLRCPRTRDLFAFLRNNRIDYFPVKAPDGRGTVWVVEASSKLEATVHCHALQSNRQPLRLADCAYPLVDVCLLPEEYRSFAYALCAIAAHCCPQWRPTDYLPVSWRGWTFLPWRVIRDFPALPVPPAIAEKIAKMPFQAIRRMGFLRLVERVSVWLKRCSKDGTIVSQGLQNGVYDALHALKQMIERWQTLPSGVRPSLTTLPPSN